MSWLGGSPSEPDCWARFKPYLSQPGEYEVYAYFYACKNTSTIVPFTVRYDGGTKPIKVDQYSFIPTWKEESLGTWYFKEGQDTYVEVTDATGEPCDSIKALTIGAIKFVNVLSDAKSTIFKTGDFVRVIADAGWNMRTEPKLGDAYIRIPPSPLPKGSEGQIMEHQDNGVFNDGHYWWYLRFGDYEGWCAEYGLESSQTCPYFSFENNSRKR
jgi:hypothetical protein